MNSQHRAWLDLMSAGNVLSSRSLILGFLREFSLSPEKAGDIIVEWIKMKGEFHVN